MKDRKRYPSRGRAARIEYELKLARAVEAYRTFYPCVSCWSFFEDNIALGMEVNRKHGHSQNTPDKNALTPNSDTPYAVILLDATDGPMVLDVPAGNIMGVMNDWYFQEAGNLGLPGPDGGKGGKYLIIGPGQDIKESSQYYTIRPQTNHCLAVLRSVPIHGIEKAKENLSKIKTYPLGENDESEMVDLTDSSFVVSTVMREENMDYWRAVHSVINDDVLLPSFYMEYGRLAALGIERGKPFPDDEETKKILLRAAGIAIEQMTVEALSTPRKDVLIWKDRQWEHAALVPDTGFYTPDFMDHYARDRWFYQATLATKSMFTHKPGVGSVYFLSTKDANGMHLTGGKTYRLSVPASVPANQFWSVTIYDVRYRSQINTDQKKAFLSSLFDEFKMNDDGSIDIYVGPKAPKGYEGQWIMSKRNEDWFAFFRIYGPDNNLFNGEWILADFEEVK